MTTTRLDESAKQRLSALLDGELDGADPAQACGIWSDDAEARQHWHAWHLIGDVLRSDDLASDPARDRALCAAVRRRLADEPVVLAPAPLPGRTRPRWAVGGAMAAGFVLVVGTFVVLRPGEHAAPVAAVAQANPAPAAVVATTATDPGAGVTPVAFNEPVVVTDLRVIRDAQLDRYLAAHKQFSGSSALGVPSAFLRSATVDVPAR